MLRATARSLKAAAESYPVVTLTSPDNREDDAWFRRLFPITATCRSCPDVRLEPTKTRAALLAQVTG